LNLLDTNRILTLTGPGGTGKTRLSLQMAAERSTFFDDGVFFVPLAPVSDPDLVASAVLDAVGLAATSANKTPEEFLAGQLENRATLLVLDNFEHVIAGAPLVSQLAQASPASKFLVTSRVPLAIGGEQEMPVPPLQTAGTTGDVSKLLQVERVRLFVERALSVQPDFNLTEDNAAAVVALVDQLDGLPLAIELVASQLKLLSPQGILDRLDLRTLGSARRDLPERQATLWGAIDWSYRLLEEPERKLFSRLSAFAGGARLEEIEAVCSPGLSLDVLSLLGRLADHSLIRSTMEQEPRFLMLHVIREFATERLEESGEAEEVRRSHAMAYANLAEKAQPELVRRDRRLWLDRLADDVDNLRAALSWAIKNQEADLASKLAFNTWRFWQGRGYLYEAESRITEILALPEETPFWRAKALEAAGGIAWWRGSNDTSREMYRRMLEIHRQGDDRAEVANALYNLGLSTPDVFGAGLGDNVLREDADREKLAEAHRLLREGEELYRELGDVAGLADVVWGRANLKLIENDHTGHLEDSLQAAELYRQAGNVFGLGWSLFEVGWAHRELGNLTEAWSYLSQALEQFGEQEDVSAVVLHLSALSSLAKQRGDMTRAVTLAGAMHQLRLKSGSDIASAEINVVEGLEYETLEELTGDLAAAYQAGKGMDLAGAVRYALTED
jgi:predicted ATPase